MRVFIVGSIPNHQPGENQPITSEHQGLFDGAVNLGWALANRGHRSIIGSTSLRTVDPYIAQGYIQYAKENPASTLHLELQYPSRDRQPGYEPTYGETPENLHLLRVENPADASSPHRWTISHFSALHTADLLITMCGGVSTRILGSYAVANRIPVLAIPDYGGASLEVFRLARHTYPSAVPRSGSSSGSDWVMRLVDFGERLVQTTTTDVHSYFLSYSWANCTTADHIELLLRRYHRMVFRDEDRVQAGLQLPSQLEASIQEADTFIALWSIAFRDSRWCPSELDFAIDSHTRTGKPRRIAAIELDDLTSTLRTSSLVRLPGSSRGAIELGIRKLIDQEFTSRPEGDID